MYTLRQCKAGNMSWFGDQQPTSKRISQTVQALFIELCTAYWQCTLPTGNVHCL